MGQRASCERYLTNERCMRKCGAMQFQLPSKEQRASLVSNTLGIVGFIILIAVLIWGLFNLISLAKPWFKSVFPARGVAIAVSAPTGNVPSGQPVSISWTHAPKNGGTYAFLYQCQNDFQFRINGNNLPCGAAYNIPGGTKSVSLTPFLLSPTSTGAKVPFTILYSPKTSAGSATGTKASGAGSAQGSGTITVVQSAAAPTPSTGAAKPAQKPSAAAKNSGHADLSVRIISVGVIHPITGNIEPRRPVSPSELVAVTFDIANIGGTRTGSWQFVAQLPTIPAHTYVSPIQAPLGPGDRIQNMLRFTPNSMGGVFSVTIDSAQQVTESNETNNTATQGI